MPGDSPGQEEWRGVPGYGGRYEASSLGRIRGARRILSQRVHRGYYRVTLTKPCEGGSRRHTVSVHRLVAAAWHGPLPSGQVTRHLNGDPFDNRPSNLAYGSLRANYEDSVDHGTATSVTGVTREHAQAIRREYAEARGALEQRIARGYGVPVSTVRAVVAGEDPSCRLGTAPT